LRKIRKISIFFSFIFLLNPSIVFAGERWILDKELSSITFELLVLLAKNVQGTFTSIEGFIEIDVDQKKNNKAIFFVDIGSIDMNYKKYKDLLLSNIFFDERQFPKVVIDTKVKLDDVILYYASNYNVPFDSVTMLASGHNNTYLGEIPPFPAGTEVYYYVEARALASFGTIAFLPAKADFGALSYRIMPLIANNSPIVINEIMAFNTRSLRDPQGEYDDWIELYNRSDKEVSLATMYLSDNKENLSKWAFPENTKMSAGGYLIVWADGDQTDQPGLHTNFKLSKNGETVMLVDASADANQILNLVEFGNQIENSSIGRYPNGTGTFRLLKETPKKENKL